LIEVTGTVPRFSQREIAAFARKVLHTLDALDRSQEISIAFVDDAAMKDLNRKFRRRNKTTDVLTFPSEDGFEIVISVDQARRQAATEKHSLATEVRYLLLHGILHGLGHDHETDHGEMNRLELKTREKVGLG
jgi:probable rRNA maturation factor